MPFMDWGALLRQRLEATACGWRGMVLGGSVQQHSVVEVASPVIQQLNTLGITASADLEAFWDLVKVRDGIDRGQTIGGGMGFVKHFAVLLEGVACLSTQHQ